MTAEEYASYINSSNNEYVGIGIIIDTTDTSKGLVVNKVYEDSPAQSAGLVTGDIITAVDGQSLVGVDASDASAMIAHEEGTEIVLTVLSGDTEHETTAVCGIVYTKPVSCRLIENNIGYIKIENFDSGAYDGFVEAYEQLLEQGAESFIFDVRNDGGGYVNQLRKILDYLLPECEIFVSVDDGGNETVYYSDEDYQDYPAVVLFNSNSYSAAEYFAAVLNEYDYAQTVGTHTTGKGRSQITVDMLDGGALHISSNEYVTPSRISLYDQGGIAPDYEVALSSEDEILLYYDELDYSQDQQLLKAVELLSK
jgi:carboxyl-terminal processing protease